MNYTGTSAHDAANVRLPKTKELSDAIIALRRLRRSYRRLFAKGKKEQRWDSCVLFHGVAVHALEAPEVAEIVDLQIRQLHADGNGAPDKGLDILNDCYEGKWRVEELERQLGRGAGFSNGELRDFAKAARKCLKRAAKHREDLPHVEDTKGLITHLADIHSLAEEVTLRPNGKIKRDERPRAERQIINRLYMVATVVANSDFGGIFNYSYAAGLGVAGHKGKLQRPLRGPARELPQGIPTPAPEV